MAAILRDLDIEAVWGAANDGERRVLIEELIDSVTVFPDHLEIRVGGAPPLNVLYSEVGLKESGERPCRRGDTRANPTLGVDRGEIHLKRLTSALSHRSIAAVTDWSTPMLNRYSRPIPLPWS